MESLIREALTREELTTIDLEKLKEHHEETQKPLDKKAARGLLKFLLSKVGEKNKNKVKPELLPKAKAALSVLAYFLAKDEAFQNEFEKMSVSQISSKLKLSRHLEEGPEEHRKMIYQLISFMSNKFPKFRNWRLYIATSLQDDVAAGLEEVSATMAEDEEGEKGEGGIDIGVFRLPPPGQYYEQESEEVVQIFNTNVDEGLTEEDVAYRRTRYGVNELPRAPPPSVLKMLIYQLTDFMVMILIVVTIIELCLREWVPSVVLFLVVFFNVVVGFLQELKAQKALEALKTLQVPHAQVIRDGITKNVEASELVPGDVVALDEGCQVPADLRLVEAINLQVVEALLTGESVPIEKKTTPITTRNPAIGDIKNMVFMSTSIMRGRGVGIVTSTGKSTEVGKITKALSKTEDNQTLLQKQLRWLGKALVAIAVVLCIIVVAINLIRYKIRGNLRKSVVGESIETGVSLGVSVIPEGLVAVVTITMALGVQRMVSKHAVVKRLAVVESLGSITVICSDKTGTLTEGNMKAEELKVCGKKYTFSGSGFSPVGDILLDGDALAEESFSESLQKSLMCCALCNNASVSYNEEKNAWIPVGDPTEIAILMAAEKARVNKNYWIEKGWSFEDEVAFDSDRKCMSVLYSCHRPQADGADASSSSSTSTTTTEEGGSGKTTTTTTQSILLGKGAPEAVVKKCTKQLNADGSRTELDEAAVGVIEQMALDMAANGLRVLALSYRPLRGDEVKSSGQPLATFESNMIFLGLIGLIDPPRMEVKGAIECCKNAGIRVYMITGDHPVTALAIAKELGIVAPDADEKALMKGADIDAISEDDIDLLATLDPFPSVFARVSPQHKLKIVEAIKMRNEICAMTGDGVNDAPAIKKAHVGVAMGLAGTDLTKDAADIILLDDNFSTIVEAIKEGRHIYDNIKKFILYLLSCNSAEVYVMLLCGIFGLPIPFSAIMILWVNLIADIPPALTLGLDPPEFDIMNRLPRDPRQNIFNWKTVVLLLYQGFSMALLTVGGYWLSLEVWDPEGLKLAYGGKLESSADSEDYKEAELGLKRSQTFALMLITYAQLIHAFLSRSVRNTLFNRFIFNNLWLDCGVFASAVLMLMGVYIPGLNTILDQVPIPAKYWLFIIGACLLHVFFVEMFKLVLRKCFKPKPGSMYYDDA